MDGEYRQFLGLQPVESLNGLDHHVNTVIVDDSGSDSDSDSDSGGDDEEEEEEDTDGDDENNGPIEMDIDIDIDHRTLHVSLVRVSENQGTTTSSPVTANGEDQHVAKRSRLNGQEKEEQSETIDGTDGMCCPICLDSWTSGGDHQICCLPCGHIYGLSCIKRWLLQKRQHGKCPQCNGKCTLKDVRILYASRIVAVDKDLPQKVRTLEAKCAVLQKKDADWSKKEDDWRKREAELSIQVDQLKKWTGYLEEVHCTLPSGQKIFDAKNYQQHCQNSFILQNSWELDGARLFDVDAFGQTIIVARRFTGAMAHQALTKISLLAPHAEETTQLHPSIKSIKDICVSPHGRLVLLATLGNRLSVLSTETNNSVLMYQLPTNAWSCTWDLRDGNYMYAGLQNGMVLEFDIRQTARPVESLKGLAINPVHTIHSIKPDSILGAGARSVLTASSVGLCHWNFGGSEERVSLVPESVNQGVCISSACGRRSGDIVATFRPKIEMTNPNTFLTQPRSTRPSPESSKGAQGVHVAYRRVDSTYQKIASAGTSVSTVRLPKSAVIDGLNQNSLFAAEDEVTGELCLRELPSFRGFQNVRCKKKPIYDVKYMMQSETFGCLSEGTLQLFKQIPH